MPGWAGIRAVAAAESRRGGRTLLVLGLLFGLVGALVAGAVALAERTGTAYPRLVSAVGLDDARLIIPADQAELAAAVPQLPGVDHAWRAGAWVAQIEGPTVSFVSFTAGAGHPDHLAQPVVTAGRTPAPTAADELLISEDVAEHSGLQLGDLVTLQLLTLPEVAAFDVGFGPPDGPTVRMRVVGIGRMPYWGGALGHALGSAAFAREYAATATATAVFVRLTGDPGAAGRFAAAYAEAAARARPSVAGTYLPADRVERPSSEVDPSVVTAERATVTGLMIFAIVLEAGGLLLVGQAMLRHHGGGRSSQPVELALGMTTAERVLARGLAAAPAAALVAGLTTAGALLAGLLEPLGSLARFEPQPGFRAPVAIALGTGTTVTGLFLAAVGVAALLAGRATVAAPAPRSTGGLTWLRRWPALLVGARLALRGRRGMPPVTTIVTSTLAVTGVVAALVFGASLDRLVDDPGRYGRHADLTVVDARSGTIDALAADPRVAALTVLYTAPVRFAGGRTVPATALAQRRGTFPAQPAVGRPPSAVGEIALGPRLAATTGWVVGDVVDLERPTGGTVRLVVTGIMVTATSDSREQLGDGVLLSPRQLPAVSLAAPLLAAEVLAAPGYARPLIDELSAGLEIEPRQVPPDVRILADLRPLPEMLAAALGVVLAAATAHALLTAGRRNSREIAVLAVMGSTPGQVRVTLAAVALSTIAPALLLGLPLGIGVGRVLWYEVATSIGVSGDIVVPVGLLAALGPAALVVALLVAVVPAVPSTRNAATALRVH